MLALGEIGSFMKYIQAIHLFISPSLPFVWKMKDTLFVHEPSLEMECTLFAFLEERLFVCNKTPVEDNVFSPFSTSAVMLSSL